MGRLAKLTLFFLTVVFIAFLGGFIFILSGEEDIRSLKHYRPGLPTKIYDFHGRIISEFSFEKRELIAYHEIPKNLVNALVAMEDQNFWTHYGVDPLAILRAFLRNLRAGRIVEGGSTLTQQLAKDLFTTRKRTLARKIKETVLALKIERFFSKEEILEMYVNQMYLGHGSYGIEIAASVYMQKHARDLSLAESALLVALLKAPAKYSPFLNPEAARRRHTAVLRRMIQSGYVSEDDARLAYTEFWTHYGSRLRRGSPSVFFTRVDRAPYFTEYIRQKLEKKFGKSFYSTGYDVYTTLDLRVQKKAREVLREGLRSYNQRFQLHRKSLAEKMGRREILLLNGALLSMGMDPVAKKGSGKPFLGKSLKVDFPQLALLSFIFSSAELSSVVDSFLELELEREKQNVMEGAIVSIEPLSGYVKALVGGSGFRAENQLNRAVQAYRQPGSAFKPFIYASAFEKGIVSPSTILTDQALVYSDGDRVWMPQNYSGSFRGETDVRMGLRKSINLLAVQVLDRVGTSEVIGKVARMMRVGIGNRREVINRFRSRLAMALGTDTFTPLEMATAYSVFVNSGRRVVPLTVRRVEDRGKIIWDPEREVREKEAGTPLEALQIFSPETCYLLLDVLKGVLSPYGGTASWAVKKEGWKGIAAGKTGTTDNWNDAWFLGMMPRLVTAVWIGVDDNSVSLGRHMAGGILAAPLWIRYMNSLSSVYNLREEFPRPENIRKLKVCSLSGHLPGPRCRRIKEEIFNSRFVPEFICHDPREYGRNSRAFSDSEEKEKEYDFVNY